MLLMCEPSPPLVYTSHNVLDHLAIASLGNLLHALYAACVRAELSLGPHSLQHASLACYSISRQPATSFLSMPTCHARVFPSHLGHVCVGGTGSCIRLVAIMAP